MGTSSKIKALDFYRKIPKDLTEASLSGAGLSMIAAFAMLFLFGMEFNNYLKITTTTSVIVDKSRDGDYLRIEFNISFPALSCEFASVDVNDIIGTARFNLTKTVRKFPVDPKLNRAGPEFHSGPVPNIQSHGDHFTVDQEGAAVLTTENFDSYANSYPILAVNFYAPWCYWSNRLKPSWEKAAQIITQRYDPDVDGRIMLAKVDCTQSQDLCRRHHIQGYPSIRIFRQGHDVREEHGHHDHESYYGERDTESLVLAMEGLLSASSGKGVLALDDKSKESNGTLKRPAPHAGGCRIEGFVKVKKVPGNLIIAARSGSHSFDASAMNMTHFVAYFSFGRKLSWRMVKEFRRLAPYLEAKEERLTEGAFISEHENITHEHYLQVVKTEVVSLKTNEEYKLLEEYEYTAHSNVLQTRQVPYVKFHYELSPMQVVIKENSKSFSHFLTNLCAIIGGVFTVAGILQSMLQNAIGMVKKVELGKQH
ncbi:hypothetical protein O6H91_23G040500 [Diphasiastrum complanatum]|uniref:Uncharacterized protein n=2 Tax=Diphasiastrum complanatum TaxID=34168 RepID=A0ACC2AA94_DIPCM|nr:hypothetical protein O6H91_23G040500 [Diphasiastrum complanatum]KAJ7514356.1 hypothetical protein O6H91_23G040500 [Diphasiastrum complanatum]